LTDIEGEKGNLLREGDDLSAAELDLLELVLCPAEEEFLLPLRIYH
jgi:hypothetical protein